MISQTTIYDGTVISVEKDKVIARIQDDGNFREIEGFSSDPNFKDLIGSDKGIFVSIYKTKNEQLVLMHLRHSGTIIKKYNFTADVDDTTVGKLRTIACIGHNVGDQIEMAVIEPIVLGHV